MFDIGFQEIVLIGVVALIVVGPERLPGMARTVGLWVGRIRFYVSSVKDDIEREMRAAELKEMLEKPPAADDLHEIVDETRSTLDSARTAIESAEADPDPASRDTTPSGEDPVADAAPGAARAGALAGPDATPAHDEDPPAAPDPDDGAAGDADERSIGRS